MKRVFLFLILIMLFACAEKLIEQPEGLISSEKMVEILNDMAILNAAQTTNGSRLESSGIESMKFIFEKHDIDSARFVLSDRYYASRPIEYESIYSRVGIRLEAEEKRLKEAKQLKDSLKQLERDSAIDQKFKSNNIKNRPLKSTEQ